MHSADIDTTHHFVSEGLSPALTTFGLGLGLGLGFPSIHQLNLERRLVEETLCWLCSIYGQNWA